MSSLSRAALAGCLFALLVPSQALGQTYPSKPVRVIIPHGPAGTNDIAGRILFQKMSEQMGKQFVMENRAGGGSTIGEAAVAESVPDGYTLMVHSTTILANAHLPRKLSYDPRSAFVGITPFASQVGIIGVHPSLPVKSIKELISLAKSRPKEIAYASAGSGSYTHMALAYFNAMAGTQMLHVPYKSGGLAGVGFASGETQVYVASYALWTPFIQRNQVRLLAAVSDERLKALPDIPTVAESGVPGFEFSSWVAVFAPAGTPRAIIDTIHAGVKNALDTPDVQKRFSQLVLEPLFMTPEHFAQVLKAGHEKYARIAAISRAKVE
jgi:tripartite-type tricarboxylate transporter receptor subunit TctC